MLAKIILAPQKLSAFKQGHPWIFPKAIKEQHHCQTGELVCITDENHQQLAIGIYNEHSLYRVRILAYGHDSTYHSLEAILTSRFNEAIRLRTLLNLPAQKTTAHRLFNSEADGLSGLTIDRFNETLVVSSSALWVEKHRPLIEKTLSACLPELEILWFPQIKPLKQDGHLAEIHEISRIENVLEAGIHFEVNFSNAQKTGLFLDQRDNHQRIASLAANQRVLDLYTYTGGFALHAAKAGATHVTAVDSSATAILQAQKNAERNQLNQIEFITKDAREYLTHAGEYDIVILDPPKLIPSKKNLEAAKNYYRFLHREIFKYMRKGSLLMTCNCSSAISAQQFNELVHTQARMMNQTTRTLGIYGPALCHPTIAGFPEGNYLTALLVAVV